jgi:hypothetical protein
MTIERPYAVEVTGGGRNSAMSRKMSKDWAAHLSVNQIATIVRLWWLQTPVDPEPAGRRAR